MDKVIAPIYSTYLLASAVPFAFTLHDLQEKYYPEYFTLAQRIWRHAANSLLTRAAARIICESSFVKRDIEKFFAVESGRIEVIPAPPMSSIGQTPLEKSTLAIVRRKFDLPDEFIFYPSQFFAHKNHIRLIEAFAEVLRRRPECKLVLTGQRQHEYARVVARVNELGLSANVLHLGFLEVRDLAAIYRLASLVVIPTLFESISIPVYEAFVLGTAVCAANVVALPEQIGDAGVLFDPLSIQDMAEKILATLENSAYRHELVERGKKRIAALTLDRYSLQLKALLDQIRQEIPARY
jgi:glycosyltransferase involved in cell wall biosynthesis